MCINSLDDKKGGKEKNDNKDDKQDFKMGIMGVYAKMPKIMTRYIMGIQRNVLESWGPVAPIITSTFLQDGCPFLLGAIRSNNLNPLPL
jgi:hypothetical protein